MRKDSQGKQASDSQYFRQKTGSCLNNTHEQWAFRCQCYECWIAILFFLQGCGRTPSGKQKNAATYCVPHTLRWVWVLPPLSRPTGSDLIFCCLFFFLHSEIIFSLRLLRNNPFVSDSYLETYTHPYIYSSKYLDALESSSKGISGGSSIKSSTRLLLCRRNNAFHPERGNPADEQSTPRGHCDPGILVSIHNTEWSSGPDRAEGVRVFSLGWVLGKSADVSWPFPPLFSLFPLLSLALSFEAYQ